MFTYTNKVVLLQCKPMNRPINAFRNKYFVHLYGVLRPTKEIFIHICQKSVQNIIERKRMLSAIHSIIGNVWS